MTIVKRMTIFFKGVFCAIVGCSDADLPLPKKVKIAVRAGFVSNYPPLAFELARNIRIQSMA